MKPKKPKILFIGILFVFFAPLVNAELNSVNIVADTSTITLGQPFNVIITGSGVNSLRGMHYIGKYCKVETDGPGCIPNHIGTDEILSSPWTFTDAPYNIRATKRFTSGTSSLVNPEHGTYRVTAEVNGVASP